MNEDRCVSCGDIVPEGTWVCPVCLCKRCGRKLKTEEARERGMGKVCWEKSKLSDNKKALFEREAK